MPCMWLVLPKKNLCSNSSSRSYFLLFRRNVCSWCKFSWISPPWWIGRSKNTSIVGKEKFCGDNVEVAVIQQISPSKNYFGCTSDLKISQRGVKVILEPTRTHDLIHGIRDKSIWKQRLAISWMLYVGKKDQWQIKILCTILYSDEAFKRNLFTFW